MSALTIDSLAVAQKLKGRGFSDAQAVGAVEALRQIDASAVVTKSDLEESAADLEVDILRWLFVSQPALGGFVFPTIEPIH